MNIKNVIFRILNFMKTLTEIDSVITRIQKKLLLKRVMSVVNDYLIIEYYIF